MLNIKYPRRHTSGARQEHDNIVDHAGFRNMDWKKNPPERENWRSTGADMIKHEFANFEQ